MKKEFMNIAEVAEYTGLSIGYIYQLTSKRLIKHYKPKGKIYFKKNDVDEYLFGKPMITTEEIEHNAINSFNR